MCSFLGVFYAIFTDLDSEVRIRHHSDKCSNVCPNIHWSICLIKVPVKYWLFITRFLPLHSDYLLEPFLCPKITNRLPYVHIVYPLFLFILLQTVQNGFALSFRVMLMLWPALATLILLSQYLVRSYYCWNYDRLLLLTSSIITEISYNKK